MKQVAEDNPFAEMLIRAISFESGARWHHESPTPIESFRWTDLPTGGVTDMGAAFKLLAQELDVEKMGTRGFPPVLILLSDGMPTDDYQSGLRELMQHRWAKKAVRVAIAIGQDADKEALKEFVANPELPVLEANNASTLAKYIRWVSCEVSKAASAPPSKTNDDDDGGTPKKSILPPPPPPSDDDDVW